MGGFFPPTADCLINRLDARLGVLAGGQVIDLAAIKPIGHANLDLVESVENIEFGERQPSALS